MINQEQTSLSWLDKEINASVFSDRRHASSFKNLMQKLWRGMGNSLPFACQDNAATKAAYRFLSSNRIDEQHLLQGHSEVTRKNIASDKAVNDACGNEFQKLIYTTIRNAEHTFS